MRKSLPALAKALLGSVRDLLPIVLVIACFQGLVLQQSPPDLFDLLAGTLLVILGLTFFIFGLELGLFPLGESMAYAFARKGSVFWLLAFAFALGFGTTVAEPALIAIADEAARVAAGAAVIAEHEQAGYAWGLRLTVALSVGLALVLGVLRILKAWPIQWLIIGGYSLAMMITPFAPSRIIGLAYDSGGVTTSAITVPLVAALGVGLASSIRGRHPLLDGFGLIALASLLPMIFVMLYGIWAQ